MKKRIEGVKKEKLPEFLREWILAGDSYGGPVVVTGESYELAKNGDIMKRNEKNH